MANISAVFRIAFSPEVKYNPPEKTLTLRRRPSHVSCWVGMLSVRAWYKFPSAHGISYQVTMLSNSSGRIFSFALLLLMRSEIFKVAAQDADPGMQCLSRETANGRFSQTHVMEFYSNTIFDEWIGLLGSFAVFEIVQTKQVGTVLSRDTLGHSRVRTRVRLSSYGGIFSRRIVDFV